MKKILLLLLILISSICFAQSRTNEVLGFQNMISNFWKQKYQQENRVFNPPNFTYTNGEFNLYYSFPKRTIITSVDMIKFMYDRYNNGVVLFAYAHEFGHFIQHDKENIDVVSIFREYQADCLAGHLFKFVSDNGLLERQDIPNVYRFFEDFSDKNVKIKDLFSRDAHGSADGRKQAFNLGFLSTDYNTCLKNYNTRQILSK